jgi:hypothetical protein
MSSKQNGKNSQTYNLLMICGEIEESSYKNNSGIGVDGLQMKI